MKLTNYEIYGLGEQLVNHITNLQVYIPAKANFFLQKNTNTVLKAYDDIFQARLTIAKQYGTLTEDGNHYQILPENEEQVNQELKELFDIEQELEIKTFKIEDLGNAEFTTAQMKAIMFMIEDL